MTVANATFGTRALFGAGDFAYSACALSARTFAPASAFDSLLIDGPGKLKLRRSAISHPAFLSASADGFELTPELTVISRRAHESALTASIPAPVFEGDILVSLRAVAKQGTTSVEAQLPVAQHVTSVVEEFSSLCLSVARHSFGGGLVLPTITCRGEARHYFSGGAASLAVTSRSTSLLPWSACTPSLTVTAPWFHTHARFTYTTYKDQAPCRREARHCFGGACTLPKFGRALRL